MKEMICVSITEPTVDEAITAAESVDADVVEIRLDCLKSFVGIGKLGRIGKPVMATCMPKWEGGLFTGKEDERAAILIEAMKFSEYVSLELRTEKDVRSRIINESNKNKKNGLKVIVAYHDYKKTPEKDEIVKILKEEKDVGADIAKIAFFAKDHRDVLRTMEALLENRTGIPVIAISMGEAGKVSRILGPLFGSYMTFASPRKGKESAPGQLTAEELREVMRILKGDEDTKPRHSKERALRRA